jgi:nitrogen fixation/metabolism regulation signal transduction histidine kinase
MSIVVLAGSILHIVFLNYITTRNLSDYFSQSQIEQIWDILRPAIVVTNIFSFVLLTLFLIILTILITHKLIGPMLKVTGHINKINSGTLPKNELKLREGDEGQSLCDAVNKLQNQMRQNYDQLEELKPLLKDKEAAEKLDNILSQMSVEK